LVKNRQALEFPLPQNVTRLIEKYVTQYRPRLVNAETNWLFPGDKGHKSETTLSQQIWERVLKEIGVRVTPHQFRHAAAAWFLQDNPGEYEIVRRVLGHRNLETTLRFYTSVSQASVFRKFQHAVGVTGMESSPA
jgi:integrase